MHHDLKHRIQAMRDKLEGRALSLKFRVARNFLSPPPRNVAGWLSWLMSGKPIAFWNPVPERAPYCRRSGMQSPGRSVTPWSCTPG